MLRSTDPIAAAPWNAEHLRALLATCFNGESIVVLANREPFQHDRAPDGAVVLRHSAGGLVTALEPLMRAYSGVWVAHGAGSADPLFVDARDGLGVPPDDPVYRLRRVWLDANEQRGYYYGFANEGLWPLCHRTEVAPIFRADDYRMYSAVNTRFADAVTEEVESDRPLVLVQDYHFALAPRIIRARLPLATIVSFWHVPWPNARDYAVCPWRRQLLEGLLGSTVVGFQTPEDCRNFVESVEASVDAQISRTRDVIVHAGGQTTVRAYPVSVQFPNRWARQSPPIETCRRAVRHSLRLPADIGLVVGVDRLDYTKGIDEKFLAVERLLELCPDVHERIVLVQIAEPSRHCLAAYQELRSRLSATAARINRRFGNDHWRPIIMREAHHEPAEVYRFLRAADVCYVGSLHDGMNLVAKEFVTARDDERGVLILSELTGAARELLQALIINPYATDACARTLGEALAMTTEEQRTRMRGLRSVVAHFNAYRWAGEMLADAARLSAVGTPNWLESEPLQPCP
jgi:trehalose 6-phosphate synthase